MPDVTVENVVSLLIHWELKEPPGVTPEEMAKAAAAVMNGIMDEGSFYALIETPGTLMRPTVEIYFHNQNWAAEIAPE